MWIPKILLKNETNAAFCFGYNTFSCWIHDAVSYLISNLHPFCYHIWAFLFVIIHSCNGSTVLFTVLNRSAFHFTVVAFLWKSSFVTSSYDGGWSWSNGIGSKFELSKSELQTCWLFCEFLNAVQLLMSPRELLASLGVNGLRALGGCLKDWDLGGGELLLSAWGGELLHWVPSLRQQQ